MRVLISGSRTGYSRPLDLADELEACFKASDQLTVVEGCADGVDHLSERWARKRHAFEFDGRTRSLQADGGSYRLELEHWPAQWGTHRDCWCPPGSTRCKYAGPRRNLEMASSGVDRVSAFSDDLRNSRGTRNMVARAHLMDIPYTIFGSPDVTVAEVAEWARSLR